MRILRLDLETFGPFSGQRLVFDTDAPGLHIIFGPNEAGKSSSLRALTALLYGFPERTTDNFLYPNDQLRVGGCLMDEEGTRISFYRRKRRKADLLDKEGKPMDQGCLTPYLGGIDAAIFETFYGIDHERLVRGGEDILALKGAVGQVLFTAGAGIASLQGILMSLEEEGHALFKARGVKQALNQAIKEYNRFKKQVKELALSVGKWKELQKNAHKTEQATEQLVQTMQAKAAEKKRLERLEKAVPELAKLRELNQQLTDLGEVVVLPPDFPEQLSRMEQDQRDVRLRQEKDQLRLAKLGEAREETVVNPNLLAQEEIIEDLYQRLGAFRKARKDRIRLSGMRISLRKEAGSLASQIRPGMPLEEAKAMQPVLGRKSMLQRLATEYETLKQRAFMVQRQILTLENEHAKLAAAEAALPVQKDFKPLLRALQLSQRVGDLDQQINVLSQEVQAVNAECQGGLARLGLWTGDLERLMTIVLPLEETVRRFESLDSRIEDEMRQTVKERQTLTTEIATVREDLRGLNHGGTLPTEHDLERSRAQRDQGWRLLCRKWVLGEEVEAECAAYAKEQPVHTVFEQYVTEADHIADRLRREAERVTRAASLTARGETLKTLLAELSQKEEALNQEKARHNTKWLALWRPMKISPLSPREMRVWLTQVDVLRTKYQAVQAKNTALMERIDTRKMHIQDLKAAFSLLEAHTLIPEEALAPIQLHAESVLEAHRVNHNHRDKLMEQMRHIKETLAKSQEELQEVTAAQNAWQNQWNNAMASFFTEGPPAGPVDPPYVLEQLEILAGCIANLSKADDLQSRIDGIDRDCTQFCNEVRDIRQKIAPDLAETTEELVILKLHALLNRARKDQELLIKIEEEHVALSQEIKTAAKQLDQLNDQKNRFYQIARCEKDADLAEVIQKSAAHQRLKEKIADSEAYLAKLSEGIPLEELEAQAATVHADDLPGQIRSLTYQIEEEDDIRLKKMMQQQGEEKTLLRQMDGGPEAARAAEEMEAAAARIRRLTHRYACVTLASRVLKEEIERYREEHQEPVLKIASVDFAQLTLGAFSGLRADLDESGAPMLVGVRRDKGGLGVAAMSSGTRDQVYLALRLATLKWRLKTMPPMPFIVDDILINFDDERSRTTLAVLSELSLTNQVILFTHHGQIVSMARSMAAEHVKVHCLNGQKGIPHE